MEDTNSPLLNTTIAAIGAMKRYEQNLAEVRQSIAKLRGQKTMLEENINLLLERLEKVNEEKEILAGRREKIKSTIYQIESFKSRMSETFDAMLSNIKKEKDYLDNSSYS